MSVHLQGKRLQIKGVGPSRLTAFLDAQGRIAISHAFWGCCLSPENLRTVLHELAPPSSPLREDALYAALHEHRRCSEEQARGIITAYLAALAAPCD
jgi:hypothetical protein